MAAIRRHGHEIWLPDKQHFEIGKGASLENGAPFLCNVNALDRPAFEISGGSAHYSFGCKIIQSRLRSG